MIPLFTLIRQNRELRQEINKSVKEVVDRGIFILGPKVEEFENAFAKYIGVKYAVGVASGTDALTLALMAVGVEKGDEVILPANAYPTAFAVTAIGAKPVLVDIDPLTYNINSQKIPESISRKTKAIIPVHLYGQPADMEKIVTIGKKYQIPVVEDCAQAHGAEIKIIQSTNNPITQLSKVGSIGDVGCFSFYPTKNLGCFGDGGMVVTNNEEIYKRVKLLRMYGEKTRYNSVLLGRNSRLDELQAAILLMKLKYLNKWNKKRRYLANLYFSTFFGRSKESGAKKERPSEGFLISLSSGDRGEPSPMASTGFPHLHHSQREITENSSRANEIQLPFEAKYANHVYHLFVIRTKKRDQLKKYLEKRGIQTAIHYPIPIHLVPSMKYLGYRKSDFPESEKACEEILSLPMFPELTHHEIISVVKTIAEFYKA